MSFPESCLAALAEQRPMPRFSEQQPEATLEDAYATQAEFVALHAANVPIIGYKAALTNTPAQAAMGIDTPIVGVLFADALSEGTQISMPSGGLLETEIGYRLRQDIVGPTTNDSVMDLIADRCAMVEVAFPNLDGRPSAVDLVATNSASYRIIEGDALPADASDLQASLSDASPLFSGSADEVMSGQVDALAWLINTVLHLGYPLHEGHLLMTGSIGGVAPAKTGNYRAGFFSGVQELAAIEFAISESQSG